MDSIEEQWSKLEKSSKQTFDEVSQQVSWPKIQDVPIYMSERIEFKRLYEPRFISFSKFSFRHLGQGVGFPYKLKWAAMYIEETNQTLGDLYQKISVYFVELRNLYGEGLVDPLESNDDIKFGMVMEGCSMLQVLEKSDLSSYEELKITLDNLLKVHQDMLLLHQQFPFKLLQLVCNDEARLYKCLHNFLKVHGLTPPESELLCRRNENRQGQAITSTAEEFKENVEENDHTDPVHLHYLRTALLVRDLHQINKKIKVTRRSSLHHRKYRIGTIRELQAAGIRVRNLTMGKRRHRDVEQI